MKKVFAFLTITFILAACGSNTAKFKPMIEELSGNWDTTTSAVTEFANMVKNEQSGIMNLTNSMKMDDAVMSAWDEATTTKFNNIQSMAQSSSTGLSSISGELDAFVSSWMEKGKGLQALKDGLSAGKLEGDVQAKITELTAANTDAMSKLDGWKEQFGKVKSAIADASSMFNEFKDAAMGDVR